MPEGVTSPADEKLITARQMELSIKALRDLVETRLTGMDTAIILLQQTANKSPTIAEVFVKFEEKFDAVEQLALERFARIDQSFVERDKRTDQLTLASSTAIAAALQAQKEAAGETQKSSTAAIAKAETATSESVKQLQTLFQTSISGLVTQIQDVKSRLDKGEGAGFGRGAAVDNFRYEQNTRREEATDNRSLIFGIVTSIIGVGTIVVGLIIHLMKRTI